MFRLIITIMFLGCMISTFAQTKKTTQVCRINEPPKLRGFFLGETVEEINKVIPNFLEFFLKQKTLEKSEGIGIGSTTFFYKNGVRQTPNKDFEDVDFYWKFFENKLYFMSVNYINFQPQNLQDFINKLSEKTGLPLKGWVFEDKYSAILKCDGFTIGVWTGEVEGKDYYKDYPSVRVTDTNIDAEVRHREKMIKLQKKKEERERIRREREKQSTFKP